jgi:hypothetical protein
MSDAQEQVQSSQEFIPENLKDAYDKMKRMEIELKELETRVKNYKNYITRSIPLELDAEGKLRGQKDGITVLMSTRSSLKYTKALDEIKETLVPKTKHEEFDMIVGSYTSFYDVAILGEEKS